MIELATFLTDFADAGVMIPLCAAVAVTLLMLGRARLALSWTAVSLAVWGTVLLLKVAGYLMAEVAPVVREQTGLVTASGHAAGAAVAYGALAGLLMGSGTTMVRRSCLAAVGIAIIIGITRVFLGEHTPAEAILGGVVGIAGAGAFAAFAREALQGSGRAALFAAAAVTLLVVHGDHINLERFIASASARAVQSLRAE